MLNNMKNLLGQKGSMMVEALAMLGLISMVTPMLYRKAAERTTELADINAASAARTLSAAMETYLAANKSVLDVVLNTDGYKELDTEVEEDGGLPAFQDYLPEGYMTSETKGKIFEGYRAAIRSKCTDGKCAYTGMVALPTVLDPDGEKIRLAKIASMIGGNGGLIEKDDGYASGVQGLWGADSGDFFDGGLDKGTIVATTVTAVGAGGSGGGIGVDEKALYRVDDGDTEKNTMQTTLYMGGQHIEGVTKLVAAADEVVKIEAAAGDGDLLEVAGNVKMKDLLAEGAANITSSLNVGDSFRTDDFDTTIDSEFINLNTDTNLNINVGNEANISATSYVAISSPDAVFLSNGAGNNIRLQNSAIEMTNNDQKITMKDSALTLTGGSSDKRNVIINDSGVAITAPGEGGKVLDVGNMLYVYKNDFVEIYPGYSFADNVVRIDGTFAVKDKFWANNDIVVSNVETRFNDDVVMNGNVIMSKDGFINDPNPSDKHIYAYVKEIILKTTDNLQWVSDGNVGIIAGNELLMRGKNVKISASGETGGSIDMEAKSDINIYATNGNVNVDSKNIVANENKFKVKDGSDTVLFVDTEYPNATADANAKDGVYIRRGAVEVASTRGVSDATFTPAGNYIMADRFISQLPSDETGMLNAYDATGVTGNASKLYDAYQVNPAYTSVMHDIKLTTRGGARLSDILPDFITKGIYVLDNSYKEAKKREGKWTNDIGSSDSYLTLTTASGVNSIKLNTNVVEDADGADITSPWLGFIPTPQCPPGYGKVVTLNPIRWRMSEMYRVNDVSEDILKNTYNEVNGSVDFSWLSESRYPARFPKEVSLSEITGTVSGNSVTFDDDQQITIVGYNSDATPPTFQTNTWLNTTVASAKQGTEFYGWSAIMGFLYNLAEYQKYLKDTGNDVSSYVTSDGITSKSDNFAWNLFPVRAGELMAIGHTYCYFERRSDKNNWGNFVDENVPTFDANGNVSNLRTGLDKGSGYKGRLNDPTAGYDDPW